MRAHHHGASLKRNGCSGEEGGELRSALAGPSSDIWMSLQVMELAA
jgi:hypothetical protein